MPPPRTSSREDTPVDVSNVEDDEGEYFVPGKSSIVAAVLRLKEDMVNWATVGAYFMHPKTEG